MKQRWGEVKNPEPKPWPIVSAKEVAKFGLFAVRKLCATSPRTGFDLDFHVIDLPDLLLVVPVTADGKFVMIRQYRHGSRKVGLEFPGGLLDPDDVSPLFGAMRELQEETGYSGGEAFSLGALNPLPAMIANRCHYFLALGVTGTVDQKLDAGEDIEVVLVDPANIGDLIGSGKIINATTVAALTLARANSNYCEVMDR